MGVLQVRPARPKSRTGTKTGVVAYFENDDLDKLRFLVGRANSNRSDVVRQAIRTLYDEVQAELREEGAA